MINSFIWLGQCSIKSCMDSGGKKFYLVRTVGYKEILYLVGAVGYKELVQSLHHLPLHDFVIGCQLVHIFFISVRNSCEKKCQLS